MSDPGALRIGFLGAGRVGCGLAKAFCDAGLNVAAAASRSRASARRLAGFAPGCAVAQAAELAAACDLIFVTVPDEAIADAAGTLRCGPEHSVVHCSGATEVSALSSAARAGAATGGFHPLQAFTEAEAAAASLPGCTVTIEAEGGLREKLGTIAASIGCRVNSLPPGKRALYHATAGYGSQFLNVLLHEIAEAWGEWGASEEDVIAAVLPMMRGTLDSIGAAGIAGGMPGPVSRGDVETVRKHVASMESEALAFYRAHCLRTVTLAERAGRIDAETAARLRAVLAG